MSIGFDRPLYVLPFDHRASFSKELFGWQGHLTQAQTAEIAAVKRVIFDAAREAVANGVPAQCAGILVDEQFGGNILRDARGEGLITACPAEKSGQEEFDFEYGSDFERHIEAFDPTFYKVLVRYNPGGDRAVNRRQAARLRQLSDYLHARPPASDQATGLPRQRCRPGRWPRSDAAHRSSTAKTCTQFRRALCTGVCGFFLSPLATLASPRPRPEAVGPRP